MGYNTVIFDLDGTLLDTAGRPDGQLQLRPVHHRRSVRTKAEIRRFVGNGIRNLMKQAVPGGTEHPQFEVAYTTMQSWYRAAQPDQDRTLCGGAGVDSDPARARHHHGRSIQ